MSGAFIFNTELFASCLTEHLEKQSLTLRSVERGSKISSATLHRIMNNKTSISMYTFMRLCNYLKFDPRDFFYHA